MPNMPNVADIDAFTDVLADIDQNLMEGGPDFETLARLREELKILKARLGDTMSMLEGEMLRQVEKNPREVNGSVYTRAPKRRVTTNHEAVLVAASAKAREDAIDKETGDFVGDPIELMRDIMVALYLSPSVKAKRAGLTHVGLKPEDVEASEIVGYELRVIE